MTSSRSARWAAWLLGMGGLIQAGIAMSVAGLAIAGALALYFVMLLIMGMGHASSEQATSTSGEVATGVGAAAFAGLLALEGVPAVLLLVAALLTGLRRQRLLCVVMAVVALGWYPSMAWMLDGATGSSSDTPTPLIPWGTLGALPAVVLLLRTDAAADFAEASQRRAQARLAPPEAVGPPTP